VPPPDLDAIARFVYEQGYLKRLPRAGWIVAGVGAPESVAAHSHRAGVIAGLLAAMEGADPARATLLAVWHDTQETRTGDVPYIGRSYVSTRPPAEVTADQTAEMPEPARSVFRDAVAEFEAGETVAAIVAKDADRLDCLAQAVEYRAEGNAEVEAWIESSLAGLRTDGAKALAEALLRQTPGSWWRHALGVEPRHP